MLSVVGKPAHPVGGGCWTPQPHLKNEPYFSWFDSWLGVWGLLEPKPKKSELCVGKNIKCLAHPGSPNHGSRSPVWGTSDPVTLHPAKPLVSRGLGKVLHFLQHTFSPFQASQGSFLDFFLFLPRTYGVIPPDLRAQCNTPGDPKAKCKKCSPPPKGHFTLKCFRIVPK